MRTSYELVVVNDGLDNTWEEIRKAAQGDENILGVRCSRDCWQGGCSIYRAYQATGDVVAVMDCNLQHPPKTLVEMYRLWEEGYRGDEGREVFRGKENVLHKKCAGFFYGIMN